MRKALGGDLLRCQPSTRTNFPVLQHGQIFSVLPNNLAFANALRSVRDKATNLFSNKASIKPKSIKTTKY